MKKQAIYCRTISGMRRRCSSEEFEKMTKRCMEAFSNRDSSVIITEPNNETFDSKIKNFKRILTSMKKYGIETVLMKDKERISDNDDEVYRVCKIADEKGIEIQFSEENISSKDVIKQYEDNNMTGMEMNL